MALQQTIKTDCTLSELSCRIQEIFKLFRMNYVELSTIKAFNKCG